MSQIEKNSKNFKKSVNRYVTELTDVENAGSQFEVEHFYFTFGNQGCK